MWINRKISITISLTITVVCVIVIGLPPTTATDSVKINSPAFSNKPDIVLGQPDDLTASVSLVDVDDDGDLDVLLAKGRHWPRVNELVINHLDTNVQKRKFTYGTADMFSVAIPLGSTANTSYAIASGDINHDGPMESIATHNNIHGFDIHAMGINGLSIRTNHYDCQLVE